MKTLWLSLGAIVAAAVAACAAGEDNSDVRVAADTTVPECHSRPPPQPQDTVPNPPNTEENVDNNGNVIRGNSGGASGSGASGSNATGATSSSGGTSCGGASSSSSTSSSSGSR